MATVFDELITPLKPFLDTQGKQIDERAASKSLYFGDFFLKLIFAQTLNIPSVRALISELQSNEKAHQLGFEPTALSTFTDAFSRFDPKDAFDAFQYTLLHCSLLSIPAFDEIGICKAVDGSLLPNISSMQWAKYKKTKNAVRLHLAFELNRMIPTEFIVQAANSSERTFLLSIVKKHVTYIADRGYFSFELAALIDNRMAFFIIRIKDNLKFNTLKTLKTSSLKEQMPSCFRNIKDAFIYFDNDPQQKKYRIIQFEVLQSKFRICSNRMDLTTLQIIMLYAYRWQIELLFKYIKRTLSGIHLFNLSQNGTNIYFYALMTTVILQLRLRQFCVYFLQFSETVKIDNIEHYDNIELLNQYMGNDPSIWIKGLSNNLYKFWKIDRHWLIHFKNLIHKPLNFKAIAFLGAH